MTKAAPPVAESVRNAVVIVVGQVAEILPPRWTTPDGTRPSSPGAGFETIFVPVVVQIEQVLKGVWEAPRCILAAYGGKIGEDEVTITPRREYIYAIGERTVLFLQYPWIPRPDLSGLPLLEVAEKYTFDSDGRVHNVYPTTPSGGTFERLTWDEFLAVVAP